jgi:hypothetical protein
MLKFLVFLLFATPVWSRPVAYTELLDYVQEAPDQGDTNTCLFVGSTGAMELIANKIHGIKNPRPGDRFDLSESWLIHAPGNVSGKSFFEQPVLRFNQAKAIHISEWPYEAWRDTTPNGSVWNRHPQMSKLPRLEVPQVETLKLFQFGNKWTTKVLNKSHIEQMKEALWKYRSPLLVNYNDEGYWHVILIVGYDDRIPGECYDTDPRECDKDLGAFYVRDSFGVPVELRDYDWFRVKGNAAFVVKPL